MSEPPPARRPPPSGAVPATGPVDLDPADAGRAHLAAGSEPTSALRVLPVDGAPDGVTDLTRALGAALDGSGPPVLPIRPSARHRAPADAPGAAVVIATSGSTGEPKLVALSAAALRSSAEATATRLGGDARWLLALPAEHVAGVQVIVRALLAGAPPVVQDLRDGFRPADFVTASRELGAGRRHTSLVPTQLLRLLDAGDAALDALLSYDAVLVGGAALEPAVRTRARTAGVRIVTTYGMSETAGGCVYDGVPLDGVTVEIHDDGGPSDSGRVLLGGPTLAQGYLGRPDETASAFRGGRFHTGDLGRWRNGRLEILGRADDMIITGGENVVPAAVERVLAAADGVREACVVGLADPEWGQIVAAAIVVEPLRPPNRDALRAAVRAELGRAAVPRSILTIPAIPLRGVGKPDRTAVAARIAAAPHPDA